jgi:hypothetical protein
VTECALTAATAPDGPTGVGLRADEQPGLEVLGDSHDGAGQTRAALRAAGHTQTIKPIPPSRAVPGGFTIHDFGIDRQAGTARCPAGSTAKSPRPARPASPRHCPLRGRCTTAKRGRTIQVHPHQDELRAARAPGRAPRPHAGRGPGRLTVTIGITRFGLAGGPVVPFRRVGAALERRRSQAEDHVGR